MPKIELHQLVAECEDFLVDGSDGRRIGVVDRVETPRAAGRPTVLLISAGWFGRRHLQVDAQAVLALDVEERRVIVDETRVAPVADDDSPAS